MNIWMKIKYLVSLKYYTTDWLLVDKFKNLKIVNLKNNKTLVRITGDRYYINKKLHHNFLKLSMFLFSHHD